MSQDHRHCNKCQSVIDLVQANLDYATLKNQIAALPQDHPSIAIFEGQLSTLQSRIAMRLCKYCWDQSYTVKPMDPTGTFVP